MLKKSLFCWLVIALVALSFTYADDEMTVKDQQVKVNGKVLYTAKGQIIDSQLVKLGRSGTQVATWTEEVDQKSVHYYAIHVDGKRWTSAKKTSYNLMLRNGAFDPTKNEQQVSRSLQSRPECRLYIVQFVTQSLKEYQQALRDLGAEVHRFIPHNSFIVRMDAQVAQQVKELPFVRWVGSMHPAYKVSTETLSLARSSQRYNIVVVSTDDKQELAREIEKIGGKVFNMGGKSIILEADLTPQQLNEVLHLDVTLWADESTPIEEDMDNARIQGGADFLEGKMDGFTGIGIRGHVLEGINREHPDFAATEHREQPIVVDDGASTSHGQSTYGQIFGSGDGDSRARGLLPDAQGLYTNYNAVYNGTPGSKGPGTRYELVERLKRDHKVMFQTASWGYSRTRDYTSRSMEMDQLIFDLDIAITQSQSNAGNQDSRPQAWAKNVISIGGLKHYNNTDFDDDKWSYGGSIGPATDGRIKPDLSAYYDQIFTTSLTGYTSSFGGTSGATPIVAGHVGLVLQMWTDGVFGNTLKAPKADRFANLPHFTTTKALLIATARQYEFEGEDHDRTRVHQGWGFPNLRRIFELRNKMLIVDEEHVIKNLESKVYQVNVASGESVFKVSMTYADPEATVNASIHRINDLDLKVTAPDGTVYWGNNGLLENMYSTPGGEANTVDTVENVFVKNPTMGTWTVEVIASELNADSHKETSELDADYALVIMGITK